MKHDLISSSLLVIIILVVIFDLVVTEITPLITKVEIHRLHVYCSYLPSRGKRSELLLTLSPQHQNNLLIQGQAKQNRTKYSNKIHTR